MEYERFLVQVPLEALRLHLKETRVTIERELMSLHSYVLSEPKLSQSANQELILRIKALRAQLKELKSKYELIAQSMATRTSYLVSQNTKMNSADGSRVAMENHLRLLIVNHYLNRGEIELARTLCLDEHSALVDWDLLILRNQIAQSLHERNPQPCLDWCRHNASFFRKTKYALELDCKLLYLRELAVKGEIGAAVSYARTITRDLSDVEYHSNRLMQATMSVVFAMKSDGTASAKQGIPQEEWDRFADEFKRMFDARYERSQDIDLAQWVTAGLFATQTYTCKKNQEKPTYAATPCPCCSADLGPLAKVLPVPHHSHSILDPDCVLLGNDRIVGLKRAQDAAKNLLKNPHTHEHEIASTILVDPVSGEKFDRYEKVFPL